MLSLGSNLEDSLYVSTYQALGAGDHAPTSADHAHKTGEVPDGGSRHGDGNVTTDLSGMQQAYSATSSSLGASSSKDQQGTSVWGVEGENESGIETEC